MWGIIKNMKANPEINQFIEDILSVDEDKGKIVISLRKLVSKIAPGAKEEIKYGGLVFVSDKRLFCGIFIRKNHISVEFDRGAELSDPDDFFEGSGKYRRHIKILQLEDIKTKKVEYFIEESCKL